MENYSSCPNEKVAPYKCLWLYLVSFSLFNILNIVDKTLIYLRK